METVNSRRGHLFRMLAQFLCALERSNRLFLRRLGVMQVDPIHCYLSEPALGVLETAGRIDIDELGSLFVGTAGRKAAILVTHQPGNMLGIILSIISCRKDSALADVEREFYVFCPCYVSLEDGLEPGGRMYSITRRAREWEKHSIHSCTIRRGLLGGDIV